MNWPIKFIVLLLIFLCHIVLASGQADSVRIKKHSREYNYAINKYSDKKSALYLGVKTNTFDITLWSDEIISGKTGAGIEAGYELKIMKYHSFSPRVYLFIDNKKSEYARFSAEYRYYYNLKSRMQSGKTGNNFYANYFVIVPAFRIERAPYGVDSYAWDFTRGLWKINYKKRVETLPTVWFGYGLQRNIFSRVNFDINAGLRFEDFFSTYNHIYFISQFSVSYIIR